MNALFFNLNGFTFFDITNEETGEPEILVNSNDNKFRTVLKWNHMGDFTLEKWVMVKEKLLTLIFNRIHLSGIFFKNFNQLQEFIDNNFIEYSPEQKSYNLLKYIKSLSQFEGDSVSLTRQIINENQIWRELYFANEREMEFYLKDLIEEELISQFGASKEGFGILSLTKRGLIALRDASYNDDSKTCFVAMSFSPELDEIYSKAIEPAIINCGYFPFIVKDQLIPTGKTINDEIIAGIKMSKFMIADFTQHRNGVYFEAGFGRGLGMEVIYTCKKDDIDNAHFDTRQYQHILWSNSEELKEQLTYRIKALLS